MIVEPLTAGGVVGGVIVALRIVERYYDRRNGTVNPTKVVCPVNGANEKITDIASKVGDIHAAYQLIPHVLIKEKIENLEDLLKSILSEMRKLNERR